MTAVELDVRDVPRPPRRRTRTALALLTLLTLGGLTFGGCAARLQPMGAPVLAPQLTDTGFVAADGVLLPVRTWQPEGEPRAVILALHGYNDYSNAFAAPGRYLAGQGVAVYAYDQRGFGATANTGIWPGAETLIADLHAMAAAVRARHPGVPFYLLGESMGGAVVMAALAERTPPDLPPLEVDGAILSAPAVWGREAMNPLHRAVLWISYNTVPWLNVSAPRDLKIRPSDNIEMLRALGRDPLVIKGSRVDAVHGLVDLMGRALDAAAHLTTPALVLYGAHEEVLPKRPVEAALAALPSSGRQTVAIYPNGYHMLLRDLQAEVVLNDIVSWIGSPSAELPSGAARKQARMVAER